MPRQPRSAAKGLNSSQSNSAQRIYRVIKPKEFHDHRDAYNGALSFTRPNHLDLKGKHKIKTQVILFLKSMSERDASTIRL